MDTKFAFGAFCGQNLFARLSTGFVDREKVGLGGSLKMDERISDLVTHLVLREILPECAGGFS